MVIGGRIEKVRPDGRKLLLLSLISFPRIRVKFCFDSFLCVFLASFFDYRFSSIGRLQEVESEGQGRKVKADLFPGLLLDADQSVPLLTICAKNLDRFGSPFVSIRVNGHPPGCWIGE